MRIAEQPAVWGPLGTNIRAIPVKGFSHEAIQAICRQLSLPIWCPVPIGDIVLCSWIGFRDYIGYRFGCIPTAISPRKSTHRDWQDVLFLFSVLQLPITSVS